MSSCVRTRDTACVQYIYSVCCTSIFVRTRTHVRGVCLRISFQFRDQVMHMDPELLLWVSYNMFIIFVLLQTDSQQCVWLVDQGEVQVWQPSLQWYLHSYSCTVLITSQVSKYKHVSSVFLCEVSADASDQQRDQLGEAGELSGEEGVAVLRLWRHRFKVVQRGPGDAHRENGDAWWLVDKRNGTGELCERLNIHNFFSTQTRSR